jgi:uncharacterized membrane protein YfcA
MSLIHNERTKLLASAVNTAATSSFAIGVLALMAAAFYNVGGGQPVKLGSLILGTAIWLSAAVGLHMAARQTLKGLRE